MNSLNNNSDKKFRNFIPYPLPNYGLKKHNACGLAATGDADSAAPADTTVKAAVKDLTAWSYAKTALALLGLYVAVKYVWGRVK
jgi:hypothetical protein